MSYWAKLSKNKRPSLAIESKVDGIEYDVVLWPLIEGDTCVVQSFTLNTDNGKVVKDDTALLPKNWEIVHK